MRQILGVGKTGKSFQDRKLAADVRNKALKDIHKVLEGKGDKFGDFKKQMLLRLAPTLLPRLNEHTGSDGVDLPQPLLYVLHNECDEKDSGTEEKD